MTVGVCGRIIRATLPLGLLLFLFFVPPQSATGTQGEDAVVLQERAIARIDAVVNHFRRTGDLQLEQHGFAQGRVELTDSAAAFEQRGDLASAALSHIKLGDLERIDKRWPDAVSAYKKGYSLAQQTGQRTYQAKALVGMTRAFWIGIGDLGAAGRSVEEAAELSKDSSDKDVHFDAMNLKGALQAELGELAAAFETLKRAFLVAEESGNETNLIYAYMERADVYYERAHQCDYQYDFQSCYSALDHASSDNSKAAEMAHRLGLKGLARMAENFVIDADQMRRLIDLREKHYKQTLDFEVFNPRTATDVLVHQYFLLNEGKRALSRPIPEEHGTKKADLPAAPIAMLDMEPFMAYAMAELRSKEALCKGLAAGFTVCDNPRSNFIRGMVYDMADQPDMALAAYMRGVELLEQDRGRLSDERERSLFFEDKVAFYYQPVQHFLSRRQHPEAFGYLERSRSRVLADLVARREIALGNDRERALYARLMQVSAEIAFEQKAHFVLRSDDPAKPAQKLRDLEGRYDALAAEIATTAPRLRDLLGVSSDPISLERLQQLAAHGGFDVLQYLVLEHGVVAWWVGPHGSEARMVFLPRSVALAKIAALRNSIHGASAGFDEAIARQLYLFLIQPLIGHVRSDRLVIIPHDELHRLPFQALIDPVDGRYLGEKFQVSFVPSATVLASLDPAGPLGDARLVAAVDRTIPYATPEVQAITALFPTRNQVLADYALPTKAMLRRVGGADIVHVAVHGNFEPEEPLLSYLKLRKEGADDGKLTAAEMFGLPLTDARLVALSACQSGEIEVTNANETLGMVRGLLYAGANALLLSQWDVDDRATVLWMETFYRAARTEPLAAAVRRANAAVMVDPRYRHPRYWAAFQLYGG
ncbi:CHAT domain-containing protein [Skermanella aerolata]|uniref:CHAT domain-containing protein n=1 Tax=Skermanella aerolata TaxID=393310 RepID=UPI003D1E2D5E